VSCPLCFSAHQTVFEIDQRRSYLLCQVCSLVFVPRDQLINDEEEKKRYELHDNSEANFDYQNYLENTAHLISSCLKKDSVGLDFGCGKTRILEKFLNEKGHKVFSYDKFFLPDDSVFKKRYDFIILSEVIEHLKKPFEDLMRLTTMLHEDGFIFVKTKLRPETPEKFKNWFYKRDVTHVQFFSDSSFKHLSSALHLAKAVQIDQDLFLFRNNRREIV
jgi:hypothetical protein